MHIFNKPSQHVRFVSISIYRWAVVAITAQVALASCFAQEQRISIPTQTAKPPQTQNPLEQNGIEQLPGVPGGPGAKHISGKPGQLSGQRFMELGYGLSFAAPGDAYQILQTADGSIVKYLCPQHINISFSIRHSSKSVRFSIRPKSSQKGRVGPQTKPLTTDELLKQAANQFGYAHPSSGQAKDKNPKLTIAGRPGAKIYFVVPEQKGPAWVEGQAFVILGPSTAAMFQMQCPADDFDQDKKFFEKLLASARLEDPQKLNSARRQQLTEGIRWLQTLTPRKIDPMLNQTHWFRLVEGKKDVGYERITVSKHQELGEKGVQVLKQLHIDLGKNSYVSVCSYFASSDSSTELWSVRSARHQGGTAKRSLPAGKLQPRDEMWVETGVRSGDRITIKRQTPTRHTSKKWDKPSTGYLSQVATQLYMGLLPHDQPHAFAFYAYDSHSNQISLRLISVKPLDHGQFQVTVRPTPDRAPRISLYNDQGQLLKRQLADGRVLIRTTTDQLRKIWHIGQ